jgi:hypothetical protein
LLGNRNGEEGLGGKNMHVMIILKCIIKTLRGLSPQANCIDRLSEIVCNGVDWIRLIQDKNQRQLHFNKAMKL